MAIDLPPALPPQLTSLESIERYAAGATPYVGIVNGYELRVTGDHHLSDEELKKIFAVAKTPSQAIILMNSMTVRKGYLLVSTQYAPDASVVYVHALQARVAAVEGEGIESYFSGLVGEPDLSRSEFDRARVMANVTSERQGLNYTTSYSVDEANPEDVSLVFESQAVEDHDPTDLVLQFGNQGSRYVGRYFGDIALSHNFSNGVRATGAYQTSFTELGEDRGGEDYHRFQLSADRAFAAGLYGISASHIEYGQDLGRVATAGSDDDPLGGLLSPIVDIVDLLLPGLLPGGGGGSQQIDLEADIQAVVLSGEQVLASDLDYRFNLFQRVEYIDSQVEVDTLGSLQDEKYGTLEVGVKYFGAKALDEQLLRWSAQFSVKGGVTGDSGTLGTYDEFVAAAIASNPNAVVPEVAPAARTAEFVALKPKLSMLLPLSADGSLSGEVTGQFANEQLPQQQQWVLGGMNTLSAYLPGTLVGDSGYFAKLSYDHKIPVGGVDLVGSAFIEYGAAWYEDVSGDLGDERSIADAGVRLTAQLGWDVTLDAVAARKLTDDGFNESDDLDDLEADFYFTLKKIF